MKILKFIPKDTAFEPGTLLEIHYLDGSVLRRTILEGCLDRQDAIDAWWEFCHEAGLPESCASSVNVLRKKEPWP